MVQLASLTRLVLPSLPACPDVVALIALRDAAREFCQRARNIRRAVPVVVADGEYSAALMLPDGDEACWLLHVDGTRQETPGYTVNHDNTVSHTEPGPHMATLTVAVVPAETAVAIDIQLSPFHDAIAAGAMARLMMTPGKEWTNPELATVKQGQFEAGIAAAISAASKQRGAKRQRTRGSFL